MNQYNEKWCDVNVYHPKIKDWPEDERPREKLIKHGATFLSDAELVALIIGSGSDGVTAVDVAKRLILDYHALAGLAECNLAELCRMKGIGSARGARLMAAFEIGRRVECCQSALSVKLSTPGDVAKYYQPSLRTLKQEIFKVILLDSGNRLIRDVDITKGTLNASLVHPREVFKAAVDYLAAGVILLHNHPSGEAQPSAQDKAMTEQLVQAGQLMGIPVMDHLIIAQKNFYSFANEGLI
ncbi:DNA repair protein RadC [bacterium]|nr:DNA repair protein RadC [bacterium]